MLKPTLLKMLPLCAVTVVSACSSDLPLTKKQPTTSLRSFTDEDRRIARLLSLGTSALRTTTSEGRAVVCVSAIDTIVARIGADGALSREQLRALAGAREIYRRRAADLYSNGARLAEAQRAAQRDYPEPSERARLAIGCLRDLT